MPQAKTKTTSRSKRDFNTAHAAWLKAQAGWVAIRGTSHRMSEAAFERLMHKRISTRELATKRLAAIKSHDLRQLACKTDALWEMLLCDFPSEAAAIRLGDFGEEEFGILKSIRRDAAHLAKGARG